MKILTKLVNVFLFFNKEGALSTSMTDISPAPHLTQSFQVQRAALVWVMLEQHELGTWLIMNVVDVKCQPNCISSQADYMLPCYLYNQCVPMELEDDIAICFIPMIRDTIQYVALCT